VAWSLLVLDRSSLIGNGGLLGMKVDVGFGVLSALDVS
jgi:hypothetical protein